MYKFLEQLMNNNTLVAVFLVSGIKLKGKITSLDDQGMLLNDTQLIFYHCIATVQDDKYVNKS